MDSDIDNQNQESINKIKNFADSVKTELLQIDNNTLKEFNDPLFIGILLFKLLEERENTNRLLKTLLQKIEQLERKIDKTDSQGINLESVQEKLELNLDLLPEQDQKIIELIKLRGKVCAAEIKEEFNYKGENAASARLNRLFALGYLKKTNVGKKVYFLLNE
ncbi:MAG: hypothetical protein N3E37_00190 [Candidatus Micrarchaeota archaeon]|nr:hypothetical protein [Candidatus Micrarchaeota archaeon]